jgi:16S rRNA (uracil1498-N3)-methyltransferase
MRCTNASVVRIVHTRAAMTARLFVELPLGAGAPLQLPPTAARHVQVLRLQPSDDVILFDGRGGEWTARVLRIGRSGVEVAVLEHDAVERELPWPVTLALGMPANERMDTVVEKATELGAVAIQPLMCERSVLRLAGERAARRRDHWQAIAIAASEQSGRTRVPVIEPVRTLADWLDTLSRSDQGAAQRWLLSLDNGLPLARPQRCEAALHVLSGPEGGLTQAEERLARERGFRGVGLGPRILRADTAPLATLAWIGLDCG